MPADGSLELWGGLECTVARLGDRYRDQVHETGHHDRLDDLDRIAALGIRTLRYPILWERVAASQPGSQDWAWHDERLGRLSRLGLRPVAGLVHHGSGPRFTDLLDPAFPRLLAAYAEAVARRYPWLDLYTPVNEPLTTARFSALYGHWYPHRRDNRSFLTALVNQCRATVLAMRAVRRINPAARLVQTDDLGRTFSTPALAYQADYENERRWLTFDLLFGRVDRQHPWWRIFVDHGVSERSLDVFLDNEVRPDIVGINHYLTSERFLDERLERYPAHLAGGNGRDAYADAEAVRVRLGSGELGPVARLREAWARYRAPIAVTEVHHGCTRDEQLRWLLEVWRAAGTIRREGGDVRAVTAWALFGARDWNTLLTREAGIYEPGAFDVRGAAPRRTALADAAEALARQGRFDHPVLDTPGWWRRRTRFYEVGSGAGRGGSRASVRAIVVLGAPSPLRRALTKIMDSRGLPHRIVEPRELARTDAAGLLADARAWAVLDLSGGSPELDRAGKAREARVPIALRRLASACAARAIPLATVAFADPQAALRETALRRLVPGLLALRTGHTFGPWDDDRILAPLLAALIARRPLGLPAGRLPLSYLPDLAHVALDLLVDGASGTWSLLNAGAVAAAELAEHVGARTGLAPVPIRLSPEIPLADPEDGRGEAADLMPPLAAALDRYLAERHLDWRQQPVALAAAE